MELQGPKVHLGPKVCQEKMDLWDNLVQEETQDYPAHLGQLGLKVLPDFKGCREERAQLDNQDKQGHQEGAFQMVKFVASAEQS